MSSANGLFDLVRVHAQFYAKEKAEVEEGIEKAIKKRHWTRGAQSNGACEYAG